MVLMGRGPKSVDESIAILRQARREAEGSHVGAAVLALALALDRSGQKDEARGVLGERAKLDPRPIIADARVQEALTNAGALGEADALVAIGLEAGTDAAATKEAWRRYAEKAKGPWADYAQSKTRGAAAGSSSGPAPGPARPGAPSGVLRPGGAR
jgi:hypothetical protein